MGKVIAIIVAVALFWMGAENMMLSSKAPDAPVASDLERLEKGDKAPANWLTLGPHTAIYSEIIFSYYSQVKGLPPNSGKSVSYAFYPVLSPKHRYAETLVHT